MKKKIGLIFTALLIMVSTFFNVNASEKEEVKVYLFRGDGCKFCEAALTYFESIEKEYGDYFELISYETFSNKDNHELMEKTAKVMNDTVTGVPYIVIGENSYNGFSESAMGEEIKQLIMSEYEKDIEDRFDAVEIANQPVKRNIVTDVIVIGAAIATIITIVFLRRQNKVEETTEEEQKEEVVVKVKKEKKIKEEKEEVKAPSKKQENKSKKTNDKKTTKKTSNSKSKK